MTSPATFERLEKEFPRHRQGVKSCVALLEEGVPAPFIARYRKQEVGGMPEGEIRALAYRLQHFEDLDRRRRSMLRILEAVPGSLSADAKEALERCPDLQALEDLYAPLKPKKIDEVEAALRKGLGPLADRIWAKDLGGKRLQEIAAEVAPAEPAEAALAGARRILIERLYEDPDWRRALRLELRENGTLVAEPGEAKGREAEKHAGYAGHREALRSIPSHRMLALRRAEREKALKVCVEIDDAKFLERVEAKLLEGLPEEPSGSEAREFLKGILRGAYPRLRDRCSSDVRVEVKERADEQAILVATKNVRHLLLAPPFGRRPVLGIDVGARTAFLAAVDPAGKPGGIQSSAVATDEEVEAFGAALRSLVEEKGIEGVTVGGGPRARVVLNKVRAALREFPRRVETVYWADSVAEHFAESPYGKSELPDLEKGARSAVFMARRFQDPLAELVKVEPKAFGIGQYQHDVGRFRLLQALAETVQSCVCRVGVDLNRASEPELRALPGFTPTLAKAVVEDRAKNGPFRSRLEIKRVPGLEGKVFHLAAAFLRLDSEESPLDATPVHPEQVPLAEKLAAAANLPLAQLVGNRRALGALDLNPLVAEGTSLETLRGVVELLAEGRRDPRGRFRPVSFRKDVQSVADLKEGMILEGVVSNVTNFGAFVDIGLEQDGLAHISELADRFVRLPHEVVQVGQVVSVRVLSVDGEKKRLSLSMREPRPERPPAKAAPAKAIPKARPRLAEKTPPKREPALVRAATSRRDGLGKAKERKGGRKKEREGGDTEKREARLQRQEDSRGIRGPSKNRRPEREAEPVGEHADAPSKAPRGPFVNNPFASFFKTQQKPEASEGAPGAS